MWWMDWERRGCTGNPSGSTKRPTVDLSVDLTVDLGQLGRFLGIQKVSPPRGRVCVTGEGTGSGTLVRYPGVSVDQ